MALLSGNDQKRWNLRRGGIWAVGSIIAAERELKTSGDGEIGGGRASGLSFSLALEQ